MLISLLRFLPIFLWNFRYTLLFNNVLSRAFV